MNNGIVKVSIFVVLMLPSALLVLFETTPSIILLYYILSSIIYYYGTLVIESKSYKSALIGMHVKLNALNHKIHSSIMNSVNNNEAISQADSLSIKETLTALSSLSINTNRVQNVSMIYTKVEPLLSVTLRDYESLAVKYGVSFTSDFSADIELRTIKFDPSKLNKIVSIILSNAVSVSERGDSIKVSTSITKEKYVIAITDNKGGIKSSIIDKLNDANLTSTGRRVDCHNQVHYGLGLISLKNLIIDSGIDIRSRTIGKYHTVYVEIYRHKSKNKVVNA